MQGAAPRRKVEHAHDDNWRIPDGLWERIQPLLPPVRPKPKGGRPRMSDQPAMDAIFSILRTGIQGKALPRTLGAPSTVHDWFGEWVKAQLFLRLWQAGLLEYEERLGLDWEWQELDGAMTKAALGGAETGANPTDRGKRRTKRSLLTEGHGLPIGLVAAGANRHDMKLTKATLQAVVIERPTPAPTNPQHLCLDKGFDYDEVREIVAASGYIAHIRPPGEETTAKQEVPGYRARRWVVERTHSWLNRFRRLLIRWEKNLDHYGSMLQLACAWITFRAAGVFG